MHEVMNYLGYSANMCYYNYGYVIYYIGFGVYRFCENNRFTELINDCEECNFEEFKFSIESNKMGLL